MKHKNNRYAGTFSEFRDFIIDKIYEDCQNEKLTNFKGYDIGFTDLSLKKDFEELLNNADGWFGVTVLQSPFSDNSNRQFISDYYGGGDFGICNIYLADVDKEYVAREVEKMFNSTFNHKSTNDICVWEVSR